MNTPKISILIPARNEEKVLPVLLNSLDELDYPKEYLQILLGNDNSGDATGQLMETFAEKKPWVEVIHLKEIKSELKGKTRVLAELAKHADGEYLFFTDADIQLPKTWIKGMLEEFHSDKNIGVVVGVTGMKTQPIKSALQAMEWLIVLSINKLLSDKKIPTTGMGNNMALSKKAYLAVGGYEKIGFSIVEDYLLYRKVIDQDFGFKQAFSKKILAFTVPPSNFFEQRRRWIQGALEHNPGPMYLGVLQALALPIYFVLLCFSPITAGLLFLFSNLVYLGFTIFIEKKLQIRGYLKYVPLFSIYLPIAWLAQFIYYFFTKNAIWKGRKY